MWRGAFGRAISFGPDRLKRVGSKLFIHMLPCLRDHRFFFLRLEAEEDRFGTVDPQADGGIGLRRPGMRRAKALSEKFGRKTKCKEKYGWLLEASVFG